MKEHRTILLAALLLAACTAAPRQKPDDGQGDIKSLEKVEGTPRHKPDEGEADIKSLARQKVDAPPSGTATGTRKSAEEEALENYRRYVQLAPNAPERSEAERRIADLQVETAGTAGANTAESITIYQKLLQEHPDAAGNDAILYQLARAYETNGQLNEALATLDEFLRRYPGATQAPEARFRSGEILFVQQRYAEAQTRYAQLAGGTDNSSFYEPAIYKLAWCGYKQANHDAALANFYRVLERHPQAYAADRDQLKLDGLPPPEQQLVQDTLRGISLALAAVGDATAAAPKLGALNGRSYERLVYRQLSLHYLSKERFSDAAKTLQLFAERHPRDPQSEKFMAEAIGIYAKGDFPTQVLGAKQSYVDRFADTTDTTQKRQIQGYRREIAVHDFDAARETQRPEELKAAIESYREFLQKHPDDAQAPAMRFQLAEMLYRTAQYPDAAREYEAIAATPAATQAAQAAYGAVISWQHEAEKQSGEARNAATRSMIASARSLTTRYPSHPERANVLLRATEAQFEFKDMDGAKASARQLVQLSPPAPQAMQYSAWSMIASIEFQQARYAEAETAYGNALKLAPATDPKRPDLLRGLAASVYQQGDQKRKAGDLRGAAVAFERVQRVAPESDIAPNALYDAGAAYITLKDWPHAITALESFRASYPKNPLQKETDRKLALAYVESGQKEKAAVEMARIGSRSGEDAGVQQEAAWQAAELHAQAGQTREAMAAYEQFVQRYPQAFERNVEAISRLIEFHSGNASRARELRRQLVQMDRGAGAKRTDRSRYLAAQASLALADEQREAFNRIALKAPLDQSLRAKKTAMETALSAYGEAAAYNAAEVTTAATCHIGEIYQGLSRALLDSPRPKNLSKQELEQYNLLLEEQAFPFEEKAIEAHVANIGRAPNGIYDRWIQRSMDTLAQLAPAKFAKAEKAEELVNALR